jgi:hypothetical protein
MGIINGIAAYIYYDLLHTLRLPTVWKFYNCDGASKLINGKCAITQQQKDRGMLRDDNDEAPLPY